MSNASDPRRGTSLDRPIDYEVKESNEFDEAIESAADDLARTPSPSASFSLNLDSNEMKEETGKLKTQGGICAFSKPSPTNTASPLRVSTRTSARRPSNGSEMAFVRPKRIDFNEEMECAVRVLTDSLPMNLKTLIKCQSEVQRIAFEKSMRNNPPHPSIYVEHHELGFEGDTTYSRKTEVPINELGA
jgi:hypothetical protein